jgi:hypothetical protein
MLAIAALFASLYNLLHRFTVSRLTTTGWGVSFWL